MLLRYTSAAPTGRAFQRRPIAPHKGNALQSPATRRTWGLRWRLQSPFREHFSQAFARFFMRVGLPAAIPPFK